MPSTRPSLAVLILFLVCACGQHAQEAKPNQADSQLIDPAPIIVGAEENFSGNSFSRNVSRQFGESEVKRLYNQLNAAPFKSKLERYACALPPFAISVVFWQEGPYQERLVRMQMTPRLYRENGCIDDAAQYLFQQEVKALDQGPPIDYGYHHSLDGSPVGAIAPLEPNEPECRCGTDAPTAAVAAEPPPGSPTAHVHYLRGNHSVTVWLDTAGIAHQKDDSMLSQRPLTGAEADAFRHLAKDLSLCSVSGRYGPEYSRTGELSWVKISAAFEGQQCYADVYDLDATRMGHDEIVKAQRVLRWGVALRKLFPGSYRSEEARVDDAFLAIP